MEVRNYPGLPQPARAAPATSSCASWGSTTQNKGFGHPPGVPSHSSAQLLAGWGGEICGWLLTWAPSLPAVSLVWEPSLTPRCSKPQFQFRESLVKCLWMCPQDKFFLWFINLLLLTGICMVYPVME